MELHSWKHNSIMKPITDDTELFSVAAPPVVRIPCQWRDRDCRPLVKAGQRVLRGEPVATTEGVSVHSPVSGKVKEITVADNCEGIPAVTVIVETDEEGGTAALPAYSDWESLDRQALYTHLQSAGIVTTYKEGATYVKALPHPDTEIRTVLLHGCSLSPDVGEGTQLPEILQEVVSGLKILLSLYPGAELVWQSEKGSLLEEILSQFPQARLLSDTVTPFDSTMRAAMRQVLGHSLVEGCSPMAEGLLPVTFQQARAANRAVLLGEPYMEQLVRVEGNGVRHPGYYQVPLGINLGEVLIAAGADESQLAKVVVGCALNGTSVSRLDLPVGKSVSSVLTFTHDEVFHYQNRPCIHCGRCYQVCPQKLLPAKIAAYAESRRWDLAVEEGVLLCGECGRCSFICPARKPLLQLMELAKRMSAKH
ncbi:MAG: 4Fe-4S dicluster domain-containing protein [Clostridia bacterium]|nr:4Fe-4S dicluster domain-containing protein [Clostridia bacterium]